MRYKAWPLAALLLICLAFSIMPVYAKGQRGEDEVTCSISGDTVTISWGEKPTGGYLLRINSVKRSGSTLIVDYSKKAPEPGAVVTQVITHPRASASLPCGTGKIKKVKLIESPWTKKNVSYALDLPAVGSAENLERLLEETGSTGLDYPVYAMDERSSLKAASPQATSGYSGTNTQVEGVDEGDLIKTDGRYIFKIGKNSLDIVEAYPPSRLKKAASIALDDGFIPVELYINGERLALVGRGIEHPATYIRPSSQVTRVYVYNIKDPSHPSQLREVSVSGSYLTSRLIGTSLYLVTDQSFWWRTGVREVALPEFSDSAAGKKKVVMDYKNIRYFPGCIRPSFLTIAGFNLGDREPAAVASYLGAGDAVYVSPENLYVVSHTVSPVQPLVKKPAAGTLLPPAADDHSLILRFALKNGSFSLTGKGEVRGSVLNQFSLDERDGFLRIATTTGTPWGEGEAAFRNHLYVLNQELKIVGKIEDIAPGERIYSARFVGNRAYLVTFRTVDPFYVIDLSSPLKPRILGALKIPGYSDYLHPLDDNHVLGFGKDTIELANKDEKGQTVATTAYYTGMKMALFDVSDVSHPKQRFVERIGDRGTDSELLHDHHALLFSREKNLIAFPVTIARVEGSPVAEGLPRYGSFDWQGALVYSLDPKQGFKEKARITHLTEEDVLKAGSIGFDQRREIRRLLYINDVLYTVSPAVIKANSLADFKELAAIELPAGEGLAVK